MKHKKTSQMLRVYEPFIHLHILPPTVLFLSSGHPSKGDQDKNWKSGTDHGGTSCSAINKIWYCTRHGGMTRVAPCRTRMLRRPCQSWPASIGICALFRQIHASFVYKSSNHNLRPWPWPCVLTSRWHPSEHPAPRCCLALMVQIHPAWQACEVNQAFENLMLHRVVSSYPPFVSQAFHSNSTCAFAKKQVRKYFRRRHWLWMGSSSTPTQRFLVMCLISNVAGILGRKTPSTFQDSQSWKLKTQW